MALDISQIVGQMLNAALPILTQGGADVGDYAKTEFDKIAKRIEYIAEQTALQKLSVDEAKILLQMQANLTKSALLVVEGLGDIVIEQAVNAALGVVRSVVNGALGFGLIV